MDGPVIVDTGNLTVRLESLRAAIQQRQPLLGALGSGELQSIYQTFMEEGSPAGSWPPLAASTLKKKGYSSGHKLLIKSGRLRNSITPEVEGDDRLVIGTGVVYAAVQNFGSAGHGLNLSAVENPLIFLSNVAAHDRHVKSQDKVATYWKGGKTRTRTVEKGSTHVRSHSRQQNIPPRPYLVFRPEDPGRIADQVQAYLEASMNGAAGAGLQ